MAVYNSLEEFEIALRVAAADTLQKEVAEVVKEIMLEEVKETVLDVYVPKVYKRRTNDGIDDPNMIKVESNDLEIRVFNDAPLNDDYGINDSGYSLSNIITTGKGYMFGNGTESYNQPRDFYETTTNKLESTGEHIIALKRGLKNRGFDVK